MRVLVIDDPAGQAAPAVDALQQAGHHVSFCHETDAGVFDCNGMPGHDGCPLDQTGIDVALVGGATGPTGEPLVDPTVRSAGAGCAMRRRVPVVIAGTPSGATPAWADDVLAPGDPDVVERIDAAARQGRIPLIEASETAARNVLERNGMGDTPVAARVVREEHRLRVMVDVEADLDDRQRERIAVRVADTVRGIDAWSPSLDVQVSTPADG
jgi:hypothetical protein